MKILIVGSDYTWSIEKFFLKYLGEKAACEVSLFPAQNILYSYLAKGAFNKIKHRIKFSSIYSKINEQLVEKIKETKPDVMWVFKGMEVTPETLMFAKAQGIKLVNYNPDNPFIFTGRGSGNKNVTDSIAIFDQYLTYSMDIMEELKTIKVNSRLLPFAYEIPVHISFEKLSEIEEDNRVCFIGNPDNDRAKIIQALLKAGIEVVIYGNDWHKFTSHPNAVLNQPVYGDDLWYTLRKYRVQLNMLRKHNLTSHNMRSFEIPGVGGIQLAPYTKEHAVFFNTDENIFLYNNTEEAVQKIKTLLNLTKPEADKIRHSAYNSCVEQGYTYKGRASEVHNIFQELLS
ncbi:CgeB family protein [Botryobacter ruber]|uniref:CgeB family protein n=1 Tax=Botryobacter ruber TaxID=2171629 RepID=UPI000E0C4318|nr:glycosyltransferase [Botryobacter ruber]